jgi:hypothetical protein
MESDKPKRAPQGYSCPSRIPIADIVCSYAAQKPNENPLIVQQFALLVSEVIWNHQGDDEAALIFQYLRHDLEAGNKLPSMDHLSK